MGHVGVRGGPGVVRVEVLLANLDRLGELGRCVGGMVSYRRVGEAFWNALSIATVHDDAGLFTFLVGVQTDFTPFNRLGERVKQA